MTGKPLQQGMDGDLAVADELFPTGSLFPVLVDMRNVSETIILACCVPLAIVRVLPAINCVVETSRGTKAHLLILEKDSRSLCD